MKVRFEKHFNTYFILPSIMVWTEPEYYMALEIWFWNRGIVIEFYNRELSK